MYILSQNKIALFKISANKLEKYKRGKRIDTVLKFCINITGNKDKIGQCAVMNVPRLKSNVFL